MRTTLAVLGVVVALGLASSAANAFPAAPGPIEQSAATMSGFEHAQYAVHRGRRGFSKCYREFVVGRYVCHRYSRW